MKENNRTEEQMANQVIVFILKKQSAQSARYAPNRMIGENA